MSVRTKPHVHSFDPAWLERGVENQIAPELEIVDSHIHLWDFSDPPYFADAYARDAREAAVSASVYVDCTMGYREDGPEALRSVGEVCFARTQAESIPVSPAVGAAIVGWADLTLGDAVDPVLEALEEASGGRLRGVRTRAAHDPDPAVGYGAGGIAAHIMRRDDFRRGVACLQRRGMILDIYAFHTQLDEVADLARAFPDLPIALNHIGGPLGVGPYAQKRARVFADWAAGMSALAECPNVSVKVGGFAISRIGIVNVTGRDRPPSSEEVADQCRPWVDHCLDVFGVKRCLFASNFPVDKIAMPLSTLVNAMKHLTRNLGLDGQRAFFAENARALYQL